MGTSEMLDVVENLDGRLMACGATNAELAMIVGALNARQTIRQVTDFLLTDDRIDRLRKSIHNKQALQVAID